LLTDSAAALLQNPDSPEPFTHPPLGNGSFERPPLGGFFFCSVGSAIFVFSENRRQSPTLTMDLRMIKTDERYRSYLEEARRLVARDPDPATPEGARLELLAKLVDDYEKERFKFRRPDPIEAILFRMEQQGLLLIREPAAGYRVTKRSRKSRR
jgi:hypothetical protein